MRQVAVITDSIACLTREQVEKERIAVVPLYIRYGEKSYRDGVDITPTQAYELFLKNPDIFSTTAATPADFLEAYRLAAKSNQEIVCITLSSKLSTTNNSARLAKEYFRQENPGVNIEVYDSYTATAAEGMIVLAAARAANAGARLPEVMASARARQKQVSAVVLLETIKHVYRSGRVPRAAAQAGSMLHIRPLFTLNGKVNLCGVVRSFERGVERMIQKIKSETANRPLALAVMHAYAPEAAADLMKRLRAEVNHREIWLTEFSPLMGYACGTGTLGIAYHPAD